MLSTLAFFVFEKNLTCQKQGFTRYWFVSIVPEFFPTKQPIRGRQ